MKAWVVGDGWWRVSANLAILQLVPEAVFVGGGSRVVCASNHTYVPKHAEIGGGRQAASYGVPRSSFAGSR